MNSQHDHREKERKQKLGEGIVSYFIGMYVKMRYRIWMLRKKSNESKVPFQNLRRICLEHTSRVTSPLALISQIEGSGGSFLNQLFDGHPELHVHPHELMIDYPERHIWPKMDLEDRPERWFEILFEDIVDGYNRVGYKMGREDNETFPFVFISSLQRAIFLNYIDSAQSITMRDIFDAYMTSYFGAWLNNQNYCGSKKFITAYMPRLGISKESMEVFFETYPDGHLISLIRDPKNWLPFARIHWPKKYEDASLAVDQWNECAQAMLWNKEKYGDRVCLLKFEDLLSKTEAVMLYMADFLGIEFDDTLLKPTFNKFPIRGDTSFKIEDQVAVSSSLSRDETMPGHQVNIIEKVTSEIYSLVLRETVRFD